MGSVSGEPGPTDAWITLAGLGPGHPAHPARAPCSPRDLPPSGPLADPVAEVDHMSGGRVEFGLGAGWYGAEHTAYGIRSRTRRALRAAG